MDLEQARDVVRIQHHAVLATRRLDSSPLMSPVLATVDHAGFVVISTRETAYKVKAIQRDPRVSLCVLPDNFFGRWIQVEGTADIIRLPEAMSGLEDYYRTISGEHPQWSEYRSAMVQERRVILRIAIHHAGPDHSG